MCRDGDTFAMWCDSTEDKIRACPSETRCSDAGQAATCPDAIKRETGERGCNAYSDGYSYGRRDTEDRKRGNYKRHDDHNSKGTADAFKQGYNAAYAKYK